MCGCARGGSFAGTVKTCDGTGLTGVVAECCGCAVPHPATVAAPRVTKRAAGRTVDRVRSTPMKPRFTRRTLIGTGATAGAAAVLPQAAGAARKARPRRADVIVVGAGLSGLQAATDVAAKGR